MVQMRKGQRFPDESLAHGRALENMRMEHLQCDIAVERGIVRPVDNPHSPRTELLEDLVMGESRPDHVPTAAENTRYSSMTPAPTK